jgi:IS5 family transposase
MLADALGRPLRFVVTGGQVNDCTQADRLLENVETEHVIADKGYTIAKGYYGRSRSLERLPSSRRGPAGRCKGSTTGIFTRGAI